MNLRLAAVKRHLGAGFVLEGVADPLVKNGEVVEVLPAELGRMERLSLVYPDRAFLEPKVRAFVDFLVPKLVTLAVN